jgi:hypothetical protein
MILDRDALGRNSLGHANVHVDTEIAACGLFALTGEAATLSYDLLAGGSIVAGTFSRGKWRALQDEIAAERAAERAARGADKGRRRAQAQAAAQAERDRRRAAWARTDAADAQAAGGRALSAALAAAAGAQWVQELARHTVALHGLALAAKAQADARAQDEDEALALLLAA